MIIKFTILSLFVLLLPSVSNEVLFRNHIPLKDKLSYVSIGFREITFFTKTNLNSELNNVTLLNLESNVSTVLNSAVNLKSNRVKSAPNSTANNNLYADEWVNSSIFKNNLSTAYQNYPVDQYNNMAFSFLKNKNGYVMASNMDEGYDFAYYLNGSLNYYLEVGGGSNVLDIFEVGDDFIITVEKYDNGYDPEYIVLYIIDLKTEDWDWLEFPSISPISAKWACSEYNLVLYSANTAYIIREFHSYRNVTISGTVNSIAINDEFVVFSVNSEIRQLHIETGKFLSIISTPNSATNVTLSIVRDLNIVVAWKYGDMWASLYILDSNYSCLASEQCSCDIGFCFRNTKSCIYGYGQPCPIFEKIDPEEPEEPEEEESQEPQSYSDDDSSSNSTIGKEKQFCLYYLQGYCQETCSKECSACLHFSSSCLECSDYYERNENGECELSLKNIVFIAFISVINVLKVFSIQNVYCLFVFDGIEFYNFHKESYEGVFKDALLYLDFIEDNIWNMFPANTITKFLNEPFPLSNYNAYTNPHFLEKRRSDSLFFQTQRNTLSLLCLLQLSPSLY